VEAELAGELGRSPRALMVFFTLMFNPLALLANLVGALLHRLAPQSKARTGIPSMADVLAFEQSSPRTTP